MEPAKPVIDKGKLEGNPKRIKSKAEINKPSDVMGDLFGTALSIPKYIKEEMDAKGLSPRFLSTKKMQESGGFHPKGWQIYVIDNPRENPLTGTTEKVYRVGDLVLGYKTKEAVAQHRAFLKAKVDAQSQQRKNAVKEMRDKIKESRADKHVQLIEGYDENGDSDDED